MAKFSEYAKDKAARDRNRVIEECAKAITHPGYVSCNDDYSRGFYSGLDDAAKQVRKLKSK